MSQQDVLIKRYTSPERPSIGRFHSQPEDFLELGVLATNADGTPDEGQDSVRSDSRAWATPHEHGQNTVASF